MTVLEQYGYTEIICPTDNTVVGRIIEVQREKYIVVTERNVVTATLKGSFYHNAQVRDDLPCVGDFVLLQYNETGVSLISELLPRKTKFSRADFLGHSAGHVKTAYEQVIAANFDYVFIVTSLNLDFKVNRIMRYLAQASQENAQPVIILTKADLLEDYSQKIAEIEIAAPNVPVHAVSAHTGFGLDALDKYLQPTKTIVFLGMSGVGKSSLLNVLMGKDVMAVSGIREDDSRGRHTTTYRRLFMLPQKNNAMVIDTPGMREIGLYDAAEGISSVFEDIEALFASCKFSNCKHETEPDCAVINAIASGTLSNERWKQYNAQKRETEYIDNKNAFMEKKRNKFKAITKYTRQLKHKNKIR